MNKTQRAKDVKTCRRTLGHVFKGIEEVLSTALKYSPNSAAFIGEVSRGQDTKSRDLLVKLTSVQIQPLITHPVAPSKEACSLYCKPSPGDRGCVYCGQPKSKHTKEAIQKGGYS